MNFSAPLTNGFWACGALGLLFTALKILHLTNLSWWWVLVPVWLPVLLLASTVLGGVMFILGMLTYVAILGKKS